MVFFKYHPDADFRGFTGETRVRGGGGRKSEYLVYYGPMVRLNPERMKKIGVAGFLFFLLKGLIWILLFVVAWAEL